MKNLTSHRKWVVLLTVALVAGMERAVWAATEVSNPAATEKQPSSPAEIERLIKQLGDKDYFVRRKAQETLSRLGFEAFDALNTATLDEDLEISSRAKYLLRLMRVEWTVPSDPPEVKKCLQDYEYEDARTREKRMEALASMPDGLGVTALCRLVRFEKSTLSSKTAALTFLRRQSPGAAASRVAIEAIQKNLQGCRRAGATWLLAWTRLVQSPEAEMGHWAATIDHEAQLLKRSPNESGVEIVAGLTRFQVAWLKKLGKQEQIATAINRLVEMERGDQETLGPLLEWLVDEKAWKGVDDLARRFASRVAAEPALLYIVAQAYAEQGKGDLAKETAGRALKLNPGKQDEQLLRHLQVAMALRNRGLFVWARPELEHVLDQSKANMNELSVITATTLAEMLHDQGQEAEAADVMERIVKELDSGKLTENELYNRRPQEIRSRMLYFRACHAAAQNDSKKQREYLDKALEAEPTDVDVLIACYRLAGQSAEYRAKIVGLIKKASEKLREEIAADAEDASSNNQLAWLVGNTEGDFDEALRCSQKSLELQPTEGGYYDTLAHVYAGKGDWENALKYQLKAAELDPHSGLVQKELAAFRKKLEEAKKK